jgi:hypothetical protein
MKKFKCFFNGHDYGKEYAIPYQTPFYTYIECKRCGKIKEIAQDSNKTDITIPNIIKYFNESFIYTLVK